MVTREWIVERVDYWRERLGLRNVAIDIDLHEADILDQPKVGNREVGEITYYPEGERAELRLAAVRSKRVIDQTIVHELCHVLCAELHDEMELMLYELSSQAADLGRQRLDLAQEKLCNRLARAFVP